jgi:prevent-host-death family protein
MYMTTVGVAELRQNLSKYLRRVARGERLVVTDRNRPVAELGPPSSTRAHHAELPLPSLIEVAGELLDAVALLPLDRALLAAAGALSEPALRALHAIHVAAALDVSPIDVFVSYDERQSAAARLAGLRTVAPA